MIKNKVIENRVFTTPMMIQYSQIKSEYSDCLLFFRLGDFYELFLDDAEIGARVLGLTLTARPRGKDGHIAMCGVPYHSANGYINKLIKHGYKIAICEQVSEPDSKGIVEREVVRIVTAGTLVSEKNLDSKSNNFIMSFHLSNKKIGVAVADLSTGAFYTKESESKVLDASNVVNFVSQIVARFSPIECILGSKNYNNIELLKTLKQNKNLNIFEFKEVTEDVEDSKKILKKHFGVNQLAHFGLDKKESSVVASSLLLSYFYYNAKNKVEHIKKIEVINDKDVVLLDNSTILNLELFHSLRDGNHKFSLFSVIDKTLTPMGARMLKTWIKEPLKTKKQIEERQSLVEEFLYNRQIRSQVEDELKQVFDIERIVAKMSVGLATPLDLHALKITLKSLQNLKNITANLNTDLAQKINLIFCDETFSQILSLLNLTLEDEPKNDLKTGGFIKANYDETLARLKDNMTGGKEWLADFEEKQKKLTGIGSLKVRYTSVFGYYIEISKANLANVPAHYFRKQTLVNAERFTTEELLKKEKEIIDAENFANKLEEKIFFELCQKILISTDILQSLSKSLAVLDCIFSLSVLAQKHQYVKPKIVTSGELNIIAGRHPVVEKLLDEVAFVPNDTTLNSQKPSMLLITGPNMAGKSVYMRQVALIVLLAHIGSFVPANSATISLVDAIFVRSGASDNIASGLSTFMVEMVETAYILQNATAKSLVIMDEIGRGTSTYDGISIACAVAEYLVNDLKAKSLFATHYHELQNLEHKHQGKIQNCQMTIEDAENNPRFLHTLVKGASSHSFGLSVAKIAGVPQKVLEVAKDTLKKLETEHLNTTNGELKINELANLDINKTTPINALELLQKLKEKYG